ncbi:MAG: recombinase family protein [Methylophilus sp.]|nr:recombinase family protein [Methylophilus sp.]
MAVALYARVSTVKQAEKDLSIPDQLNQMRDWCAANGHAVAMEYIEPGASATDDRRPSFQQMVADATSDSQPYEAIIVHSRSRFFRDLFEFLNYERMLKRANCKIVSITQQTTDDPAGEMASKIFSLFDEYQSKENGKHTLRAMRENARRGYINGSKPPFGYRALEVDVIGCKGKKKKVIDVDPMESVIVKQIYDFYLHGNNKGSMGAKEIATHLNQKNILMRTQKWNRSRVHEVLCNKAYIGEYYFNKRNNKTKRIKPQEEWIKLAIQPIIEADTFEAARIRRAERAPDKVPPRLVNSPTLLTGLLKCGCCGAGMTTATGKGGRYRYYKCNTRIGQGIDLCTSKAIPMEKLDQLVLAKLADEVFTPQRVLTMMQEMRKRQLNSAKDQTERLKPLQKELEAIKQGSERLFEAVEKGFLPMDETLQQRSHKLQTRRQDILIEIAGLKRQQEMPTDVLKPAYVNQFTSVLKTKLLDRESNFGKHYLKLLISDITVKGNEAQITGSYAALAGAILETKKGTELSVPTSVSNWLPDLDSNF